MFPRHLYCINRMSCHPCKARLHWYKNALYILPVYLHSLIVLRNLLLIQIFSFLQNVFILYSFLPPFEKSTSSCYPSYPSSKYTFYSFYSFLLVFSKTTVCLSVFQIRSDIGFQYLQNLYHLYTAHYIELVPLNNI